MDNQPRTPSFSVQRQTKLLHNLLQAIIIPVVLALVFVLFLNETNKWPYTILISIIALFLVYAFQINKKGDYPQAARVTIFAALIGPWGSVIIDSSILKGDYIPLLYIIVTIVLSSIFLTMAETMLISIAQLVLLTFVIFTSSALYAQNWPSVITFVVFIIVLSIVTNYIRSQDLDMLYHQTALLEASQKKLRQQSIQDSLTGLYNRRYLDGLLDNLLVKANFDEEMVSIIMMDIDKFKEINDTYGHAAGDEVLVQVGQALNNLIRPSDFICRYGGDELVAVFPGMPPHIVKRRAKAFCKQMESLTVMVDEHEIENISLSAGTATYPFDAQDKDYLLRTADRNLYQAKQAG